jgi:hypothetical protein
MKKKKSDNQVFDADEKAEAEEESRIVEALAIKSHLETRELVHHRQRPYRPFFCHLSADPVLCSHLVLLVVTQLHHALLFLRRNQVPWKGDLPHLQARHR